MLSICVCELQEKRKKNCKEATENDTCPFRKPLTQLNNRPACMDGNKHVGAV